jgi:hypothetical protein
MNPTTPEWPWLPITEAPKDGTWIEVQRDEYYTDKVQWDARLGAWTNRVCAIPQPSLFRPLPSTETGERECVFGDSWDTVPPTAADRKRCGCRRCLSTDPLTPSAEEERWRILEDPLFQLRLFGTFLQGGSPNELRNRVDEELTRRKMKLEGITPKEIHDDLQALNRAAKPQ